jgi:hypothetical protein
MPAIDRTDSLPAGRCHAKPAGASGLSAGLGRGRPSDGDDLLGMEIDFDAYLAGGVFPGTSAALWQDMTVHRHDGALWLITGRATGR